MRTSEPRALRVGGWVVVGLFLASGTLHLVRPGVFTAMVPDVLPAHLLLVQLSGVAELVCAGGLLWRRSRRAAGFASVALLVAVFPANVSMALEAWGSWQDGGRSGWYVLATLVRLPLQVPLIWWAWRPTRIHQGDRAGR